MTRLSRATTHVGMNPLLVAVLHAQMRNTSRAILSAANLPALTDSSTGVAGAAPVLIPTQNSKVAASGANLVERTALAASLVKSNNAMAVIATYLNTPLTLVDVTAITLNNGVVTTPGTIPAQDKTGTATDGTAGGGVLRTEFNSAISAARNNFAVLLRVYNVLATAVGVATLPDATGGNAGTRLALVNLVTVSTAPGTAVATLDLATKAAADAALTALATNIATLAAKISNPLFLSATLTARIPTTLIP